MHLHLSNWPPEAQVLTAQCGTGCLALHRTGGVHCCCMHLPILQVTSAGLQSAASGKFNKLCLGAAGAGTASL